MSALSSTIRISSCPRALAMLSLALLSLALVVEGIVFCMFDNRTNLARQVVEEVGAHFEGLVYETRIPVNIRLSESPSHGKPALLYDIESKGAQAYLQLAREVLARREGAPPEAPGQ